MASWSLRVGLVSLTGLIIHCTPPRPVPPDAGAAPSSTPHPKAGVTAMIAKTRSASTTAAQTDVPALDAKRPPRPAWAYADGVTEVDGFVYAVGRATGIRNSGLARAVAENRARAMIAHYVGKNAEEGATLAGVDIVDHWTDPRSGSMFARARWQPGGP